MNRPGSFDNMSGRSRSQPTETQKTHRMLSARLTAQELLPDSDALLIVPVRPSALKAVVSVRRYVLVLEDFRRELLKLPHQREVSQGADAVLAVTRDVYDLVERSLHKLVVNLTYSDEPDPLARDGTPNT